MPAPAKRLDREWCQSVGRLLRVPNCFLDDRRYFRSAKDVPLGAVVIFRGQALTTATSTTSAAETSHDTRLRVRSSR